MHKEAGYYPVNFHSEKLLTIVPTILHELVVGEVLTEEWSDVVVRAFSWAYTPEGPKHWKDLRGYNRPLTKEDYIVLTEFFNISVKEITKEDIV